MTNGICWRPEPVSVTDPELGCPYNTTPQGSLSGGKDNSSIVGQSLGANSAMTSVTDIGNLSVVEPKGASGLSSETTIMELEKGALPNPNGRVPLVELPYSLRTRKLKIAILVLLVCLDGFILPTALFYILKYGGMSDGKNVAVTTSVFGFMSIIQFTVRLYRLLKPRSPYLPLNSPSRWYLDFYQIQFTMGFIMITLVLTLATVSPSTGKLYLRAISLPPALLMFQCGPQFLLSCYAYKAKWKNAFRMSSMLAGENCVPAVYTMVEDVIGVDGRGGRDFRQRWKDRYTQSERFREMCYRQTIFWGVGITVCAALTTGVVFAEGVDEYVAYGIGWCLPFIWAGCQAVITTIWVQKDLKLEWEEWYGDTGTAAAAAGAAAEREETPPGNGWRVDSVIAVPSSAATALSGPNVRESAVTVHI